MGYYSGSDASESVLGGYEEDSIYLYGGNDTASGGFAGDWIEGGSGNDMLGGGYQDDFLYGEEGNDRIYGGSGNDYIEGGAGGDLMNGGAGDDRFVQDDLREVVGDRINGGSGIDELQLSFGWAGRGVAFTVRDPLLVSRTWGLTFTAVESFSIEGSDYGDAFTGWIYDDDFEGGGGNDRLSGGLGIDHLDGEDGNDVLSGGGDNDNLYGGGGHDRIGGDGGDDALYGATGNDVLGGGTGHDDIEGGRGRDRLFGGSGNDTLYSDEYSNDDAHERDILNAAAGNDRLALGENDVANAGAGVDHVTLHFSESTVGERWNFSAAQKTFNNGAVVVNAEALTYYGGDGIDAIAGGARADQLYGGGRGDRLNGGAGNDFLDGEDGNDLLLGGTGNDRLSHDSGNDRLFGHGGNDTFVIAYDEQALAPYNVAIDGGAGRDRVDFSSLTLGAVVDLLAQSRNDGLAHGKRIANVEVLDGTALDDSFAGTHARNVLGGDSGGDYLAGRGGNDWLAGNGGSDMLVGGAGRDAFDFTDYGSGWMADTVADFRRGQDDLRFDRSDFGAGLRLVNSANPLATTGRPTLTFETDTDRLWYDADGASDTDSPDLLMTLNGVNGLAWSDFNFV